MQPSPDKFNMTSTISVLSSIWSFSLCIFGGFWVVVFDSFFLLSSSAPQSVLRVLLYVLNVRYLSISLPIKKNQKNQITYISLMIICTIARQICSKNKILYSYTAFELMRSSYNPSIQGLSWVHFIFFKDHISARDENFILKCSPCDHSVWRAEVWITSLTVALEYIFRHPLDSSNVSYFWYRRQLLTTSTISVFPTPYMRSSSCDLILDQSCFDTIRGGTS